MDANENAAAAQAEVCTPLHKTTALCPDCLQELPADVYADAEGVVWMERTCPDHGSLATRMWPDAEHYQWLRSLAFPKTAPQGTIPASKPCPFGCGTCSRHQRRGTLLEIEVTRNCNLHCPVCFMSAETGEGDPTLDEISDMYDVIANAVGTDGAVQITGGEPTCRKDLPEIIRMGREKGFWGIEVNTNGLVIAARDGYLEELVWAGLTGVYLSFDGLTGEVYEGTCGRDILDVKMRVIERCREVGIQVVLSVAVVAGLNDGQLGDLLRFCLDNADVVAGLGPAAGVHVRPLRRRARPAHELGRRDLPAGRAVERAHRAARRVAAGVFEPAVRHGRVLRERRAARGRAGASVGLLPGHARHDDGGVPRGVLARQPAGVSVFLDILDKKGVEVASGLSVVIMNYMDAVSMDTQRLRECSMMVTRLLRGRCQRSAGPTGAPFCRSARTI
ncbi:MAG: radical SAM protein [Gordonibacter pamelaeae]